MNTTKTPKRLDRGLHRNRLGAILIVAQMIAGAGYLHADRWDLAPTTNRPPARIGHSLTAINGTLYLFGGYSPEVKGDLLDDIWCYADRDRDWTKITPTASPLPPARQKHSAAASGGNLYIFYGLDAENNRYDDIWCYLPAENRWQRENSTGSPPPACHSHSTVATGGGAIILFGGLTTGGAINDRPYIYTPGSGQWRQGSPAPSGGRYGHVAVFLQDLMFVYGGYDSNGLAQTMQSYDPNQDQWAVVPTNGLMPSKRVYHGGAAMGNWIWIFGGLDDSGVKGSLGDLWEYNGSINSWTRKADPPVAIQQSKAAYLSVAGGSGLVYVVGGKIGVTYNTNMYVYTPDAVSQVIGLAGDYDGDYKADPASFAPLTADWIIRCSTRNYAATNLAGLFPAVADMIPAMPDFDGDEKSDPTVYDPATGQWTVLLSSANYTKLTVPLLVQGVGWSACPADFDGDRLGDPAVYQQASGDWQLFLSGADYAPMPLPSFLGGVGYTACPADFDGDRKADPAAYQDTSGNWEMYLSTANYASLQLSAFLGGPGDVACPADYDGDRLADPATFNAVTGEWIIMISSAGYDKIRVVF